MGLPFSRKWTPSLQNTLKTIAKVQLTRTSHILKKIPNARTMPDLHSLPIGSAKRMNAAIMFFDFENFTSITSHITPEEVLTILNSSTAMVMRVIKEWHGTVEKHTGDGVMAILGTETTNLALIAQEAIESAQTIRYMMLNEVHPLLQSNGLPLLNFRIGIEMGEVLISRIGFIKTNFLTAVGSAANRASKLEALAKSNGITIGENLARSLHPYLHRFLIKGDDPKWDWHYDDKVTPYSYYHYNYDWVEPNQWLTNEWYKVKKSATEPFIY